MLLQGNQDVKPTWLLRETGNLALEADLRIPPNQKKTLPRLRNVSYPEQNVIKSRPTEKNRCKFSEYTLVKKFSYTVQKLFW